MELVSEERGVGPGLPDSDAPNPDSPSSSPGRSPRQRAPPWQAGLGACFSRSLPAWTLSMCSMSSTRRYGRRGGSWRRTPWPGLSSSRRRELCITRPHSRPATGWPAAPSTHFLPPAWRRCLLWHRPSWSLWSHPGLRASARHPPWRYWRASRSSEGPCSGSQARHWVVCRAGAGFSPLAFLLME